MALVAAGIAGQCLVLVAAGAYHRIAIAHRHVVAPMPQSTSLL